MGADVGADAGVQPVIAESQRQPAGRALPIVASRMGHLWDGLCRAYELLGFDQAAGADEVFRDLVLARIIEPTSKLDSCGCSARSE